MPLYFLVLERGTFHDQIRPPLAAAWRQRSFAPCRELAAALLPAARRFAERYHLGPEPPLLAQVETGLPFDRALWQHVAGECLWFGAADIPEVSTSPDALRRLLAPPTEPDPVDQIHRGSRAVVFGGGRYCPGNAGWNDVADVQRLAVFLAAARPESWAPNALAGLPGLDDPAERAEEVELLREWFGELLAVYRNAAAQQCVIICEVVE